MCYFCFNSKLPPEDKEKVSPSSLEAAANLLSCKKGLSRSEALARDLFAESSDDDDDDDEYDEGFLDSFTKGLETTSPSASTAVALKAAAPSASTAAASKAAAPGASTAAASKAAVPGASTAAASNSAPSSSTATTSKSSTAAAATGIEKVDADTSAEGSSGVPRIDKWWTGSSDLILHGFLEGTSTQFKSNSEVSTLARNHHDVECADGSTYHLLNHKSDFTKARRKETAKKREIGSPALSVAQVKDDRTSQQLRMAITRTESFMKMTVYGPSVESDKMPHHSTYVLSRDQIIDEPHRPRNGMVARNKPMWTVMMPPGGTKKQLADELEELLASLRPAGTDKNKKKKPEKVDQKIVHTAMEFLDNIYGTGSGDKLTAAPPAKKKKRN